MVKIGWLSARDGRSGRPYVSEVLLLDGFTHVATRILESFDCFTAGDARFQHYKCDRYPITGGFKRSFSFCAWHSGCAFEDGDAALGQFLVLYVNVNHQIAIDIAEPGHGSGGEHIQYHFLRS